MNTMRELFPDRATTIYHIVLMALIGIFLSIGAYTVYDGIWGDGPTPRCKCCCCQQR
jgi:hypothetical protein